jgi:hypothetical protein
MSNQSSANTCPLLDQLIGGLRHDVTSSDNGASDGDRTSGHLASAGPLLPTYIEPLAA